MGITSAGLFFPFFFVYMVFSFIELSARLRVEENQKIKNQIVYFLFAFGMAYTSFNRLFCHIWDPDISGELYFNGRLLFYHCVCCYETSFVEYLFSLSAAPPPG